MVAPERGRQPAPPRPSPALDGVLAGFDAEMVALAARIERLGMVSNPNPPIHS